MRFKFLSLKLFTLPYISEGLYIINPKLKILDISFTLLSDFINEETNILSLLVNANLFVLAELDEQQIIADNLSKNSLLLFLW